MNSNRHFHISVLCLASLLLTACGGQSGAENENKLSAEKIKQLIPARVQDRESWAQDILEITDELKIPQNAENMCTIVAVVDQESNFVANPVVPGLGNKAATEIKERLQDKLGKTMAGYFENMLKTKPTPDDNYLNQIKKVKTEKDLDQLYREMFSYYSQQYHVSLLTGAAKLVGEDLAERFNPITTLGSMQVHVNYAKQNKRSYMNINQLRDELYTEYGGLYYGIHRLMMYPANYDKPLYRFADYNSGMYSSRNAAFQKMLNKLMDEKEKLDLDGDLLQYNKDGDVKLQKSGTEQALMQYFSKDPTAPSAGDIRSDLKKEKTQAFENTNTYKYVIKKYQDKIGHDAPYAIMPKVVISGPKLSRDYNTNWYAERVNSRYVSCMQRAKRLKLKIS
ncbi:DUF1615 family protein [Acinetobacter qingfengensis]|uniref:Uncharacterized protein n=1 Tax=Acinetobacter qingfengensis TaxID=1262585 RepID=A0A1E7R5T1_9GAMM|nr:DUF1615 domain-containing protein [Acinetobacter qingfengensis]KAA8735596.1 DUF1615 family protein [Acinetobacter qingfengensis]OEY94637.1 hypothetical protein BJI46_13400 [Acinetobacter qingfengensis]